LIILHHLINIKQRPSRLILYKYTIINLKGEVANGLQF
jgi:hypothetical protein